MGANCNIDFKELEKLIGNIRNTNTTNICTTCTKELGARVLSKAIKRTPVGKSISHFEDYKDEHRNEIIYKRGKNKGKTKQNEVFTHIGGTLRNSWNAENTLDVGKIANTYNLKIINSIEYAPYVEYGHRHKKSFVPGKLMLTKSVDEVKFASQRILENRIQKIFEDCFNDK